jgi:hypothetical protein
MTHLVEQLRGEAERNIATMREAALCARETHARAELMRHMLMTAGKVKEQPVDQAIRFIVDHWLEAWHLDRTSWPHVAEMEAFAAAFHSYAVAPTDAHDADVRATCAKLEHVFAEAGMPLADQMAWRSVCAHGWWGEVRPAPSGRGRPDRDWPSQPFWEHGCLPECL